MMVLISGGSGSGKSSFAEQRIMELSGENRVYLATMQVWGEEDRQRVQKHRLMRQNKGFVTIEQTTCLGQVQLPGNSVVLLEDLSNLCANECFGGSGFNGAFDRILRDILILKESASSLVIVTNELFSDGITYPEETERYLRLLSSLNQALAERADEVYEVVCGIPICWKGAKHGAI